MSAPFTPTPRLEQQNASLVSTAGSRIWSMECATPESLSKTTRKPADELKRENLHARAENSMVTRGDRVIRACKMAVIGSTKNKHA